MELMNWNTDADPISKNRQIVYGLDLGWIVIGSM
jgi:hypothetical protein